MQETINNKYRVRPKRLLIFQSCIVEGGCGYLPNTINYMQVNITMVKITIKDVKAYNLSCLFSILKDKRVKSLSLIIGEIEL